MESQGWVQVKEKTLYFHPALFLEDEGRRQKWNLEIRLSECTRPIFRPKNRILEVGSRECALEAILVFTLKKWGFIGELTKRRNSKGFYRNNTITCTLE